jgi:hypothetical protein
MEFRDEITPHRSELQDQMEFVWPRPPLKGVTRRNVTQISSAPLTETHVLW